MSIKYVQGKLNLEILGFIGFIICKILWRKVNTSKMRVDAEFEFGAPLIPFFFKSHITKNDTLIICGNR